MAHENLHDLIDRFLETKRESDGGYAPVTQVDMDQLRIIFNALVKAKWEPDPDGDHPVRAKFIDRTRHEPSHYVPVPYCPDDIISREHRRAVSLNAALANSAMDRMMKLADSGEWKFE